MRVTCRCSCAWDGVGLLLCRGSRRVLDFQPVACSVLVVWLRQPMMQDIFLTLFQKSGVEEDYSDTLSEAACVLNGSGWRVARCLLSGLGCVIKLSM